MPSHGRVQFPNAKYCLAYQPCARRASSSAVVSSAGAASGANWTVAMRGRAADSSCTMPRIAAARSPDRQASGEYSEA